MGLPLLTFFIDLAFISSVFLLLAAALFAGDIVATHTHERVEHIKENGISSLGREEKTSHPRRAAGRNLAIG
jgi:hypothetical protein